MRRPPDQMCQTQEEQESTEPQDNPEDGITTDVDTLLANRKSAGKISTWNDLWGALFPADNIATIPSAGKAPNPPG